MKACRGTRGYSWKFPILSTACIFSSELNGPIMEKKSVELLNQQQLQQSGQCEWVSCTKGFYWTDSLLTVRPTAAWYVHQHYFSVSRSKNHERNMNGEKLLQTREPPRYLAGAQPFVSSQACLAEIRARAQLLALLALTRVCSSCQPWMSRSISSLTQQDCHLSLSVHMPS